MVDMTAQGLVRFTKIRLDSASQICILNGEGRIDGGGRS